MKKIVPVLLLTILLSACTYLTPIIGVYSYAHDVTEQQQDRFILNNEKALIRLRNEGVLPEDIELQYYVSNFTESFYNEYTDEIGVGRNDYGYEQIMATLDYIYHDHANYGLMFGLANYVSRDMGTRYMGFAHSEDEIISYVSYNQEVMDLTYPVFNKIYADINMMAYAHEYANMFSTYIIDTYGIAELDRLIKEENPDVFAEVYYRLLNEYNATIGIPEYTPDSYVIFDRHPDEYELSWVTNNANWHLSKHFFDTFFFISYPDMLRDDFISVVSLIRDLDGEMSRVKTVLDRDEVSYPKIRIYLVKTNNSGYYRNNVTYLSSIFSLSHEYIHHIQSNYMYGSTWLKESMAVYYSLDYEYTSEYFNRIYQLQGLQDEIATAVAKYREVYGMYPRVADDIYEFANVYVFANEDYDDVYMEYNNYSYFQYISFTKYFIDEYGEELYRELLLDEDSVFTETGYTWSTHISNWEEFIKDRYEEEPTQ